MIFVACTKEDKEVRLDPILSTSETKNITNTSATVIGFITSFGSGFTEKGVCYSLTAVPTIDAATKVVCLIDTITATFEVTLTGLDYATKYYARAYAISPNGTMYGEEVTFTTLPNVPTVTTLAITAITGNSAASGGEVTDDGRASVTARGVCFSVLPNPIISDSLTVDGEGLGAFTSALSNLDGNTMYYVRAYATNSKGTSYGADVQFATYPLALYMIGDGVISGGHEWDWTIDLPMIPVNGQPHLFWKIVWLNATGGFKMNSEKAWNNNEFGKTGDATDGVYSKGGDNIPVPGTAGYYMVVVNFITGKIAIADPKVYLMGDAIGSWDTGNAAGLFTVDNANSVVTITKTLAASSLRMYAWHPWFSDWWRSEFNIIGGKIEFRGNGGDQAAVNISAGSNKIDLNFKTGDGSITLLP